MTSSHLPPAVLCFGASDPTSGSGLQSDVLTVASMGGLPLSVVTALMVRDTRGVDEFLAIDSESVAAQARAVLEDIPVLAFKLGALGNVETVAAIAEILSDYPDLPLVLELEHPYGQSDDAVDDLFSSLAELILPQVTVLIGSRHELQQFASLACDGDDIDERDEDEDASEASAGGGIVDDAVTRLLAMGAECVLMTGADDHGPQLVNILFGAEGVVRTDAWERLPGQYLGARSTLGAALAAALAHGMEVPEAAREAQEFTWQALAGAYRPGMGLALPDRFFWARAADEDAE